MRTLFLLALVMFLFIGCFLPQQAQQAKQTFTFDYTPKESAKSGSAGMSIGLAKPFYAASFTAGSGELFKSFQSAIGSDIEEQIIAKGFTLKGPYQSLDEMVFDDKKYTDILIQIEINPQFTAVEGSWKSHLSIIGATTSYSYAGKASLVGKINLSGVEPLTNEKIWSKSVQIPNVENITIQTSNKYPTMLGTSELINDPGVYNALGAALQKQYSGIMDKIAAHFNKDEFATLKGQIKELKSRKGY